MPAMLMPMLMLILAQDVPGPPGDEEAAPHITAGRKCVRSSDEIMVCAGGGDSRRLLPLPEPGTRRALGPAAVQLSPNKRATLRAENSGNPTVSAPRMMMDFKIAF